MLISNTELDSKCSRDDIPLECYQCGRTHYRTKNIVLRILNGNLRNTMKGCFCSKKCDTLYHTKASYYTCLQCGNPVRRVPSAVTDNNVFCNSSCAATYTNRQRHSGHKRPDSVCFYCQKPFRGCRKTVRFCSHKCQWDFKRIDIYKKIEAGTYKSATNATLRKYLIEKHGEKCILCGWDKLHPVTGRCPVQVDHIDGNTENCKSDNIRLICPCCHSLTPTYMNLNKGRGNRSSPY